MKVYFVFQNIQKVLQIFAIFKSLTNNFPFLFQVSYVSKSFWPKLISTDSPIIPTFYSDT